MGKIINLPEARKMAGKRVGMLRAELGLDKTHFAGEAGIGTAMLRKIEAGTNAVDLKYRVKVAKALNISTREIDPDKITEWHYKTDESLLTYFQDQQEKLNSNGIGHDEFSEATKEVLTIVGRFEAAAADFMRTCRLVSTTRVALRIRWLGITMHHGVPVLSDLLHQLTRHVTQYSIEVQVAMLDSTGDPQGLLPNALLERAKIGRELLEELQSKYQTLSGEGRRVEITPYFYQNLPVIHGFGIDERLYFSLCSWSTDDQLLGAENLYALICPGEGRKMDIRLAAIFDSWFKKACSQSHKC